MLNSGPAQCLLAENPAGTRLSGTTSQPHRGLGRADAVPLAMTAPQLPCYQHDTHFFLVMAQAGHLAGKLHESFEIQRFVHANRCSASPATNSAPARRRRRLSIALRRPRRDADCDRCPLGVRRSSRQAPSLAGTAYPVLAAARKGASQETARKWVRPNPATLPYKSDVLDFVREARASGRETVLATASDVLVANEVAAHLGCFTGVIASNGITNLSDEQKSAALVSRFGIGGFDYVGDSHADLTSWAAADRAVVVDPSPLLLRRAAHTCERAPSVQGTQALAAAMLRALRVHQWVKNLLVFVPLVMAHEVANGDKLLATCVTFALFSLLASGIYITNDLFDLESDRQHPRKKRRPSLRAISRFRLELDLRGTTLRCAPVGLSAIAAARLAVCPLRTAHSRPHIHIA